MTNTLDIAVVVQRYGSEIIGGAESHARMISERLAASGKYNVEVLTTTSRSVKWDDYFPAGVSVQNGVTIRRFRTETTRSAWFSLLHQIAKFKNLSFISNSLPSHFVEAFEQFWYRAQGPYCPSLLEAIGSNRLNHHKFIFFTYLYFPTAIGLPLVGQRSLLVPTLHEEAALFNLGTHRLLQAARKILANTTVERDLILQIDADLHSKTSVVGVGIDVPDFTTRMAHDTKPYGLYLGRVGRAKGVHRLIQSYLKLRMAGQVDWDLSLIHI